jgi:hypothetical protein
MPFWRTKTTTTTGIIPFSVLPYAHFPLISPSLSFALAEGGGVAILFHKSIRSVSPFAGSGVIRIEPIHGLRER